MIILKSEIESANKILMSYWPLGKFIASNPLWSLTDSSHSDVLRSPLYSGFMNIDYYLEQYESQRISKNDLKQAFQKIENKMPSDQELELWVSNSRSLSNKSIEHILYTMQLDEYEFQVPETIIKDKIFVIMRDYFGRKCYKKTNLKAYWCSQDETANSLYSDNPIIDGINYCLAKLTISNKFAIDYLQAIYIRVYGWGSLMKWRNQHPNNEWIPGNDPCETLLLMWLHYECEMLKDTKHQYKAPTLPVPKVNPDYYIWQTAFELSYMNNLYRLLSENNFCQSVQVDKKHDAQFIFCIDTRSEGIRRHIEQQGSYQTFGYAGFFGVIFKLQDKNNISYQAPALVQPDSLLKLNKKQGLIKSLVLQFNKIIKYTKEQFNAPFALFEMLGFWFAFFMLFKSAENRLKIKDNNTISININNILSTDEQFDCAYNLLSTIGLVEHFSDTVVICAHQSDTANNPFNSALNCGACGGNSGIPNAIVICDILNDKLIRNKLNKAGISIPDSTNFLPACHHTGYDRVEFLNQQPSAKIIQDIAIASKALADEKMNQLPGSAPLSQRERCWAELVPELGLINNTAIIIGPRALSSEHNLQRRVFLHSYDFTLDRDGDILADILSAPAIVAHWISAQYYFSTVDPDTFGAGNKAIHNVLPEIGVLEGNLSDLKIGLPLQSTHFKSLPLHEPMKLIVVVYAPKSSLERALSKAPEFKQLLDNQWLNLMHIEPLT